MPEKEHEHEVTFVMGEHLGVISDNERGYRKELNMVSWNGCAEKFDLREWFEGHHKMSRGITLNREEIATLKSILSELEL